MPAEILVDIDEVVADVFFLEGKKAIQLSSIDLLFIECLQVCLAVVFVEWLVLILD